MKHKHDASCPPNCSRVKDLDPHANTDSWKIVTRAGLKRQSERPRWWPFAMMAWRRLIDFGILILAAVLLKHCGLTVGGP
jgi:hypothetical protein